MESWKDQLLHEMVTPNGVTLFLVLIVLISIIGGFRRGGASSARWAFVYGIELLSTILAIGVAWRLAGLLSPLLQQVLEQARWQPELTVELSSLQQWWYTFFTSVRDFSLFRQAVLSLFLFVVVRLLMGIVLAVVGPAWLAGVTSRSDRSPQSSVQDSKRYISRYASRLTGAMVGGGMGLLRALQLVLVCYIANTHLFSEPLSNYLRQSIAYQIASEQVIRPLAGEWLDQKLPLLTRAAQQQYEQVLIRRYEWIDAHVPPHISEAAEHIVANGKNDEEKAKLLYRWVGTRIQYDWEKVRLFEEKQVWNEQSPQDTFTTRKGVCIDYARLYAVMARSVGLGVHVVTGKGYDGLGTYGPHAWNEVYLSEKGQWVPLDATWASSGANWFNPPHFERTHIRDV